MFGKLGLHVMQFPSGRWGYVGNVPGVLCAEVPATTADVLGCRARRASDGSLVAWKVPTFDSCGEALAHADRHGCEVSQRDELPV